MTKHSSNDLTPTKPNTSETSEMLTPSELEQLRRVGNEKIAYAQKVLAAKRKPKEP